MGKTRGLFKKTRDTKETFHAKMDTIKERNGMDLTEAENMKKRKKESEVAQSCPTLCDPVGCSLPGSSLLGVLQARILERIASGKNTQKNYTRKILMTQTTDNHHSPRA